ncbi:MAG: hypothetical protein PUD81_01700 [Eggerthellales bacterium]|nr:hypothetical protein [Eggerthellales bacterium]
MGKKKTIANAKRTLCFIDIENMVGTSRITLEAVKEFKIKFDELFNPDNSNLVVVGTSGTDNYMSAALGWKGARQVMKFGHNGADEALIDAMRSQPMGAIEKIVVASGDGIFANVIEEFAKLVPVDVLYREGSLSKSLSQLPVNKFAYAQCV